MVTILLPGRFIKAARCTGSDGGVGGDCRPQTADRRLKTRMPPKIGGVPPVMRRGNEPSDTGERCAGAAGRKPVVPALCRRMS